MTPNPKLVLRRSRAFHLATFWAYQCLAVVLNGYVRWKFGSRVSFVFLSNPAHQRLQIEGLKPVVLCDDEDTLQQCTQLHLLEQGLRKLPFLARLSLMTKEEMQTFQRHYRTRGSYRQLKAIQKLMALIDQLEAHPESRAKSLASITSLFQEFGFQEFDESLSADFDVETAKAALLRVLEKVAHEWIAREKIEPNEMADVKGFGSHIWRKEFYNATASPGESLSPAALFFWSMVTPGLYEFLGPSIERVQKLRPLWESNVVLEFLLRLGETRVTGHPMPQWIEEDIEELQQSRQMKSGLVLVESNSVKLPEPYCMRPFDWMSVTCEGDVFMCCWQSKPHMSPGNVARSSVNEVWNSPKYQNVRKDILAGRMPQLCAEAEGCPYHQTKNSPSYYQFDPKKSPGLIDIHLPNFFCNIGGYRPSEKTPACIMCERNTKGYRFQDAKDFDLVLKRLSALVPHAHAIHIQGVAEPFWKDAIFDVFDKIGYDAHRDHVHLSTVSNGTVFTPERQKRFLDRCGATSISVSVDAATSDTYRKIRRLNVWDTLVKNLRHFGKVRRDYSNKRFRMQNNINMLNVHEVTAMVQLAAEVGVDCLELNPTGGNPVEHLVSPSNAHIFKKAQEEACREAERLGLTLEILRPLDLGLVEKSLN